MSNTTTRDANPTAAKKNETTHTRDDVRETALKELREEIREFGETGWAGADAKTLKILAGVIDDRAGLLDACEAARYELERLKSAINATPDAPIALGNTGVTLGRLDVAIAKATGGAR